MSKLGKTTQDSINILVVDDDDTIRKLISQTLAREENMMVSDVPSNLAACELLRNHSFDVVLLDWDLSGSNESYENDDTGRCVLELSRKLYPDMPVIVMSGIVSYDIRPEVFSLEADSYLAKPFVGLTFAQHIINCVSRSRRATEWFQFGNEDEILSLHELKRRYVVAAVKFFGGKQINAAKALNISRNTVNAILKSEPQAG